MALKLRRGTDAERTAVTPAVGELVYTTDTKKVYVGDGSTVGGNIVSGQNDIVDDTTPQLGGPLDLNGNNIVGTGNINITGTITATGNINLGDNAGGDVINVGGVIGSNLVPDEHDFRDLGTSSIHWKEAWIGQLNVSSQITAERIEANIIASDSTVVFDASTGLISASQVSGTFTGNVVGTLTGNVTGVLDGDMTGSVYGDDSTLLIDGINSTVVAPTINSNEINTPSLFVEGSSTNGVIRIGNNNGGAALGDQDNLGRILFGEDDITPYWTVGVTKDYYTMFPNPTGTPDYTKFAQVWKNGKFQIGGEPGGSGFVGWEREPAADLEVYGDAIVHFKLTTGNLEINQNTITMTDSNGNLRLATSGTGTIELDVPTQTTVGSAGAADALPATPSTYFKINVGGTDYVVPAYAVS